MTRSDLSDCPGERSGASAAILGTCLFLLCGAIACETAAPNGSDAGPSVGGAIGADATAPIANDAGSTLAGSTAGADASTVRPGATLSDAGPIIDTGMSNADAGAGADGGGPGWEGCDEFQMPPDCTVPSGAVLPGELRCTGLYANWQERKLRCGVKAYVPAHELWADGARKQRYVWLPPGKKIDVSNPDDFDYPVGTRFWKEFYVGPEGSQKLGETRYLVKVAAGWLYTAYVWSADGATANQENEGVPNLFASGHTVPSREQCKGCHIGRPNFILGWDFIMLAEGAMGITARDLAAEGRFNGLNPAWLELKIPGNAVERTALTYMHANCGVSCHNGTIDATGNPSGLQLRLDVGDLANVLATDAVDGINQKPAPNAKTAGVPNRNYYDIRPGDPERSLLYVRMTIRGSESAMPPIGSHVVHQDGLNAVRAWITGMSADAGYPAPAP